MKSKFVNPFTDFGFKKIFGEEASKDLLMDFLNALLPANDTIVELTFKNTEHLGQTELDRKAVYDIYCENGSGEKFIVELQKAKQNYFKDRTIYYSTFPIQEQAEKGEWNYKLKSVYCIGVLDFTFDDYEKGENKREVLHTVVLKDQNNKNFYEKLKYIYLEMPNFNKKEDELENRLDKWLYFIKHLEDFQNIPDIFKDKVFEKAFEKAELAKLSEEDKSVYQQSLKVFRDNKNTFDYARDTAFSEGLEAGMQAGIQAGLQEGIEKGIAEGLQAGILEGKIAVAKTLLNKGLAIDFIAEATGLSKSEIENIPK